MPIKYEDIKIYTPRKSSIPSYSSHSLT